MTYRVSNRTFDDARPARCPFNLERREAYRFESQLCFCDNVFPFYYFYNRSHYLSVWTLDICKRQEGAKQSCSSRLEHINRQDETPHRHIKLVVSAEKFGVHVCGGTHYQSRMSRSHLWKRTGCLQCPCAPKNHACDGGSYPIHATWSGRERREELHGDDTPAEKTPECLNPSGCGRGGLTFSDVAKGSCDSVKCRHWKR